MFLLISAQCSAAAQQHCFDTVIKMLQLQRNRKDKHISAMYVESINILKTLGLSDLQRAANFRVL